MKAHKPNQKKAHKQRERKEMRFVCNNRATTEQELMRKHETPTVYPTTTGPSTTKESTNMLTTTTTESHVRTEEN